MPRRERSQRAAAVAACAALQTTEATYSHLLGKVGRFLVPASHYTPPVAAYEYGKFCLDEGGELDFRFQDNSGSLWSRLKDGGGMPELQSVAEDMIADALAHPKPAAARQTTAASRKEDGPHEEFFQRDATNFHIDLDAMSTLVVCACCGEERGSHEFTDKTYGGASLRLRTRQLAAAKVRLPCPQSLIRIRSSPLHIPSTPTYVRVNYPSLPLFKRVNQTELRHSTAESFG